MREKVCVAAIVLGFIAAPCVVDAQFFFDLFDGYAAGSTIAGQGGWETWAGDPGLDASVVSHISKSPPNALAVSGVADIVHQFAGATTGSWLLSVQTYVPSSQTGNLYVVLLNYYDVAGTSSNWSVQLRMSATDGLASSVGGSGTPGTGSTAIITDQWVEVRVEVSLDENFYRLWYGEVLVDTLPWTLTGDINIAALNLFSDGSSESYIDDVVLERDLSIVHYWPFDGDTLDLVGGSHGSFIGSPAFVPGMRGQGLLFNGSSDAVSAAVDINPAVLPTLTIGAWVLTNDDTPIRHVMSHDNGSFDRSLCIDNRGPGGLGWSAFAGAHQVMGGSVPAAFGVYQMVAVTYDESSNEAMLYVDGVAENAPTAMGSGFPFINIGRNPHVGGGEYFAGVIDEVFISDNALTVYELDQIRLRGHPPGEFPFFIDGFESADTRYWSKTTP